MHNRIIVTVFTFIVIRIPEAIQQKAVIYTFRHKNIRFVGRFALTVSLRMVSH